MTGYLMAVLLCADVRRLQILWRVRNEDNMKVTKAVIPAAGLGREPAGRKAQPKEMLPIRQTHHQYVWKRRSRGIEDNYYHRAE